jgi:hypothetical protein
MATNTQGETASELLLQEGRLAQAAQAAATSHRRQNLLAFKWLAIGAMLGYSVDELGNQAIAGQPASWAIFCLALMLAAVVAWQMRKA